MCYLQSCAICLTERTFTDEIEYDLESASEIYLQFFIDWCFKMKTYCLECKTNTDKILKCLKQKIIGYLCNQNVVFVKMKSQDL